MMRALWAGPERDDLAHGIPQALAQDAGGGVARPGVPESGAVLKLEIALADHEHDDSVRHSMAGGEATVVAGGDRHHRRGAPQDVLLHRIPHGV